MQFTALLAISLATLSSSLPTAPASDLSRVSSNTLSARGVEWMGQALWGHQVIGELWINGGCVSMDKTGNNAHIMKGKRCRFYREPNCRNQIGGGEGLPGQSEINRRVNQAIENYRSVTCWHG